MHDELCTCAHCRRIVEPGHDRFGAEFRYPHLYIREPVEIDLDHLLAVRDVYDWCMEAGSHPEWTIGGAQVWT